MNKEQLLKRGDLVHIKAELSPSRSHFSKDKDAVIEYSYSEKFGGDNVTKYSIYIESEGSVSWYDEDDLILIEAGRHDIIEKWKADAKKLSEQVSNIDWIFENGPTIITGQGIHSDTINTLAKCMGIDNLWGSRGEGIVYYQNAMFVLKTAKPFLLTKDKKGWLKTCDSIEVPRTKII